MDEDGPTVPPGEQDHGVADGIEGRRSGRNNLPPRHSNGRNFTTTMSIASDPENFLYAGRIRKGPSAPFGDDDLEDTNHEDFAGQAGDDADNELTLSDRLDPDMLTIGQDQLSINTPVDSRPRQPSLTQSRKSMDFDLTFEDLHSDPDNVALPLSESSARVSTRPSTRPPSRGAMIKAKRKAIYDRSFSTNTILYNPIDQSDVQSTTISKIPTATSKESKPALSAATALQEIPTNPTPSNRKTGKQRRPIPTERGNLSPNQNISQPFLSQEATRTARKPYSFDIVSDLGDNKPPAGGYMATMPASFGTDMEFMTRDINHTNNKNNIKNINNNNDNNNNVNSKNNNDNEQQRRISKLMLARMTTLEESFREVLREVKDWRHHQGDADDDDDDGDAASSESLPSSLLAVPIAGRDRDRDRDRGGKGFKKV